MPRHIFQGSIFPEEYQDKIILHISYLSSRPPNIEPASLRVFLPIGERALISFRIGIDCNHTLPVPRIVARKMPSPPKTMDFRLPAVSILKSRVDSKATTHPVSIRRVSLFN